ncbi:MAG TPA: cache domain-containing protein [Syntrophobacteraceae bacterium]|nr:cache domain-containing protein [Syntrophobacteraceae bacterium]
MPGSMQLKLMLLLFAFVLVPLCTVGIFSVRTAEELILNMATNQIEHVAADKAALLERWISERKADIQVLAGSSVLSLLDTGQMASYLESVRRHYKVYSDISLVSTQGDPIYSSSGTAARGEKEPWFRESLRGALHASDISLNPDQTASFFRISAPLVGRAGKIEGVLCATVGTNAILSDVLRISLGKTGECYLVNGEGTFLAHKEPRRILTQNIAQSESFKNIFDTRNRRITYIDYRGVEVIGASARVGGTDWALVVEQDRDEAFQSADKLRHYVVLIVALSTLGALISAWLLSRYILLPIRKLSEAADCLARGEFDRVNIETNRSDEIGTLYSAFEDMARQLEDRQSRLEERVTLREAELKETDVLLKQTRQAAARSQQLASLGRLAAGVAHEIRTPLTSLKMFLEGLELDADMAPEAEADLKVAMIQIQRMEATIHRFLSFARPQDPVFAEVDLKELMEDALLVVRPRANQQETFLRTAIPRGLPTVLGDRKQLGEALLNLMVNALEALGNRGELDVEVAPWTNPANKPDSDWVRIDIKDTGPGIEAENLPRLFDPFFTTKATGTGLGLSIVAGTVQRHGGRVEVCSLPGEGTVFSVFLPAS